MIIESKKKMNKKGGEIRFEEYPLNLLEEGFMKSHGIFDRERLLGLVDKVKNGGREVC